MAVAARSKPDRPPVPLKLRLKAWWEGCDVIVHQREAQAAPAAEAPPRKAIGYRDPDRPWQTPRAKLAAMLWGEGFSHPGDTGHVLQLAKPFALDPAMTVVDLCAGLGGGARAIAGEFGVWVSGMEPDRELAEAGMQISLEAGLGKKAEIVAYDPAALDIRAGTVDCFLCRQLLHRLADKPRFLRAVDRALKKRGQIVLTDYMLAEPSAKESPAVKAWTDAEAAPLDPWTVDEYAAALEQVGLDLRVTEDMTAAFRSMVLNGWAGLTAATEGASLDPDLVRILVEELERWTRRIAALESGGVKLVRLYALKDEGIRSLSGA